MDEHEKRREQRRQAQARYRKVHADRLRTARRIAHMLARQTFTPVTSRSWLLQSGAWSVRNMPAH